MTSSEKDCGADIWDTLAPLLSSRRCEVESGGVLSIFIDVTEKNKSLKL